MPHLQSGSPGVFHLGIAAAELDAYGAALGLANRACAAETLARAIAVDSWWGTVGAARLIVGAGDCPSISVLAVSLPGLPERLALQAAGLRSACRRLRYLTYEEAARAAGELAEKLRHELGDELLQRCEYTAVPRGGWFVLGLLSYSLGLSSERFIASTATDVPLVVVDDCVLSGARFGQWLERHPGREVVFAHLYSHPEARRSICERESAVRTCVAAGDLRDGWEGEGTDRLEDWEAAWRQHLTGRRYWLGRVEHLCFPWSEPERVVLDREAGTVETAWRLLPGERSLSNAARAQNPGVPVSLLRPAPGPIRPAAAVVYGELDGQTVVADLHRGHTLALSGTAAEFWELLVSTGTQAGALRLLEARYPDCTNRIAPDLDGFVTELCSRGLLEVNRSS